MRVILSTYGSRGDVEPVAGLAVQLQALGAETVVCAPKEQEFAGLLSRAGVPFAPVSSSVRQLVKDREKMAPGDLPARAAGIMAAQYDTIEAEAAKGCDAIVATGLFPSCAAAQAVAERRGVHYALGTFCPLWLPSEHHPPHAFAMYPNPVGLTGNRALWKFDIGVRNALFGESYNTLRTSIGLPPVDNVRDHVFTDHPWLASDPVLSPWQPTDMCDAVQTGAWILPDTRPLPPDLLAFLEAGDPPVYVGFGSMPMQSAKDAARIAVEAARASGRRVVLLSGWAELDPGSNSDVFVSGDVNQQALFRRVAAIIHHGGAGTTTTATRAGAPQVVVPQIADQPYFAERIATLGVGAAHDGPSPTFESLSAALHIVLASKTCERAAEVSTMIRPDGAVAAAKFVLEGLS